MGYADKLYEITKFIKKYEILGKECPYVFHLSKKGQCTLCCVIIDIKDGVAAEVKIPKFVDRIQTLRHFIQESRGQLHEIQTSDLISYSKLDVGTGVFINQRVIRNYIRNINDLEVLNGFLFQQNIGELIIDFQGLPIKVNFKHYLSNSFATQIVIRGCQNLQVKDVEGMFSNQYMKYISIEDTLDLSNVDQIYHMFSECRSLKNLDLSNIIFDEICDQRAAFYDCMQLEWIKFPVIKFMEDCVLDSMFENCVALDDVNFKNLHFNKVAHAVKMFRYCQSFIELDIPSLSLAWSGIMAEECFQFCRKLKTIKLKEFDASELRRVSGHGQSIRNIFQVCDELETVYNFYSTYGYDSWAAEHIGIIRSKAWNRANPNYFKTVTFIDNGQQYTLQQKEGQ